MRITKPRTQRKKLFQAPAHRRYKHFSATLSPDLKEKHGTNAVPVKVGDTVRVMRGDRKGFEGKIMRVDRKKYRVFVEGVTREKVDGTTLQIPVHPSKVMILDLDLADKWRREAIKRKGMTIERAGPEAVVEEKADEVPKAKEAAKKPRKRKRQKEEPQKRAPKKVRKTRKTEKPKRKRTIKTGSEKRS